MQNAYYVDNEHFTFNIIRKIAYFHKRKFSNRMNAAHVQKQTNAHCYSKTEKDLLQFGQFL